MQNVAVRKFKLRLTNDIHFSSSRCLFCLFSLVLFLCFVFIFFLVCAHHSVYVMPFRQMAAITFHMADFFFCVLHRDCCPLLLLLRYHEHGLSTVVHIYTGYSRFGKVTFHLLIYREMCGHDMKKKCI